MSRRPQIRHDRPTPRILWDELRHGCAPRTWVVRCWSQRYRIWVTYPPVPYARRLELVRRLRAELREERAAMRAELREARREED